MKLTQEMAGKTGRDFILVMGVSGCGKSTVGAALASALGGTYIEGDSLHPLSNIAAMRAGRPLDDAMRQPWLQSICVAALRQPATGGPVVVGCSALKRRYRDQLRRHLPGLVPVHLDGSADVLRNRMERRKDHFMPASLLTSQIADLEPPGSDEGAIRVDVALPLDRMLGDILTSLAAIGISPRSSGG